MVEVHVSYNVRLLVNLFYFEQTGYIPVMGKLSVIGRFITKVQAQTRY